MSQRFHHLLLRHLRGNLVAYLALLVALSSSSYAATTTLLPANSVGTRQIINHSVRRVDLRTPLPRGPHGPMGLRGPSGPTGEQGPQGPPGASGAGRVHLTSAQLDVTGTVIRAFVPTDNSSDKCLVTLSESAKYAQWGTTVYCSTRTYLGKQGILIGIFLPQVLPSDGAFDLTVYQEGAQHYGPPVFYPGL